MLVSRSEASDALAADTAPAAQTTRKPFVRPVVDEQVLRQRRGVQADAALRREQDLEFARALEADQEREAEKQRKSREEVRV